MSTQAGGTIVYPSFQKHLEALRSSKGFTPGDIGKLVGVEEHTVIGWFDGSPPSTNLRATIEKELEYSFREWRFAECANTACFPPASAPEEIRALRTYAAFLAYIQGAVRQIPQSAIIAFLGWKNLNSAQRTLDGTFTPESERLTESLRRLPELPRHLRGDVLSACTPRAMFGVIIRDCRKRRNLAMEAYGKRVKKEWGVSEGVTRGLEEEARGIRTPSKRAATRERSEGGRGGYFRDLATVEKLVRFLDAERRALGIESEEEPAPDRSAPQALLPPPRPDSRPDAAGQAAHAAPPTGHHATAADVLRRLRALVARIGSSDGTAGILHVPKSTVRDALRSDAKVKPATIDRLDAELARVEVQLSGVQPPVAPPLPASLPSDDRLTRVVAEIEDLKAQVARLQGAPRNDNGGALAAAADNFPFTRERFHEHDDVVGDDVLSAISQRIRAVIKDLAYLAGIRDDRLREAVREHHSVRGDVEDLFVAIEGFIKQYPSRALEQLERQREWTREHGGIVPPVPSQPRR